MCRERCKDQQRKKDKEQINTSAITSAKAELHSNNQRRGVMPFVLFWNFSGFISKKSWNLRAMLSASNPSSDQKKSTGYLQITLEDVRVDLGDAIDSVGSDDTQVRHVDAFALVLFNERHAADTVVVAGEDSANILKSMTTQNVSNSDGIQNNRKCRFCLTWRCRKLIS